MHKARDRLLEGKEIKIVYDDPWFWKVSAYVNKKPEKKEKKVPRISYEDGADEYGRDIPRACSPHTPKVEPIEVSKLTITNPEHIEQDNSDPAYNALKIEYGALVFPKKKAPRKASQSKPSVPVALEY